MLAIKESNYFLKLQCLLKKDNFAHKVAKEKNKLLEPTTN
jgi:hypothetical protein